MVPMTSKGFDALAFTTRLGEAEAWRPRLNISEFKFKLLLNDPVTHK